MLGIHVPCRAAAVAAAVACRPMASAMPGGRSCSIQGSCRHHRARTDPVCLPRQFTLELEAGAAGVLVVAAAAAAT